MYWLEVFLQVTTGILFGAVTTLMLVYHHYDDDEDLDQDD